MLNDFINLFYPNNCVCCNQVLRKGEEDVCIICLSELPRTSYINQSENHITKLFWGRIELTYGFSTFHFGKKGKMQELIHQLKYKSKTNIGVFLGKEMGKEILQFLPSNTFDLIIPIPLHPKKERQRGYNQSDYIAKGISEIIKTPFSSEVIRRKVYTDSQTRKTKFERWENVASIFELVDTSKLENKHILLVDDVITTGSTIEACAQHFTKIKGLKISVALAASGK